MSQYCARHSSVDLRQLSRALEDAKRSEEHADDVITAELARGSHKMTYNPDTLSFEVPDTGTEEIVMLFSERHYENGTSGLCIPNISFGLQIKSMSLVCPKP